MAEMVLADVMNEIARRVEEFGDQGLFAGRCYGWPNPAISPPAFVVGYPPSLGFDATMQRGSDRALFPCWAIYGNPNEERSRDVASSFLLSLKQALDGKAEGIWSSARAQDITLETVSNDDGTEFLASRFNVDVVT